MPKPKPITSASGSMAHAAVHTQKRGGSGRANAACPTAAAAMAWEKIVGTLDGVVGHAPLDADLADERDHRLVQRVGVVALECLARLELRVEAEVGRLGAAAERDSELDLLQAGNLSLHRLEA